jgi:hypothetical protein
MNGVGFSFLRRFPAAMFFRARKEEDCGGMEGIWDSSSEITRCEAYPFVCCEPGLGGEILWVYISLGYLEICEVVESIRFTSRLRRTCVNPSQVQAAKSPGSLAAGLVTGCPWRHGYGLRETRGKLR